MPAVREIALALAASTLLPLPLPAAAALGALASSVEVDQAHMNATRDVNAAALYTVHTLTVPSGTEIHEFVSNETGLVFAVAWRGPFMPDLQQLLGESFQTFVDAANSGGARGSGVVQKPGLVVFSGGHMRAYSGKAYLPDKMPSGVSVDEIR